MEGDGKLNGWVVGGGLGCRLAVTAHAPRLAL